MLKNWVSECVSKQIDQEPIVQKTITPQLCVK